MAAARNKTLRGVGVVGVVDELTPDRSLQAAHRRDSKQLLSRGYQLLDRLGAGGMGEVWRARSLRLDRLVAIKRVSADLPGSNELLVREARAIACLRHPSIVQVFDVVYDDEGVPYLVMELLEGSDLGVVVATGGPLEEQRAVRLMVGIVAGLETAHRSGIVHGDVKPENILLTIDATGTESAVLLDFGIAHSVAPVGRETMTLAGTPAFMAPEQVMGTMAGPRADQWSACVTLYTIITGREPFVRESTLAMFDAIRTAPLPYPRDVAMDPALFAIVARGTRKEPVQRYDDITELRVALQTWLRAKTARPSPPPSSTVDPSRKP